MDAAAQKGLPLAATDVPPGVAVEPHPRGGVRVLDYEEWRRARNPAMLPEAVAISDFYSLAFDGNPVGQLGGMSGGLLPERLLMTTLDATSRLLRIELDEWALRMLYLVDSVRFKYDIERFNRAQATKPGK